MMSQTQVTSRGISEDTPTRTLPLRGTENPFFRKGDGDF